MTVATPQVRIRVVCVDDHRIVLDGLALTIGQQVDMEVVGSAATGEEAVSMFERLRPDVTLMDLQLGSMSGVDAIRNIRRNHPAARIVVLTMSQGDEDIHRALQAGAVAYLLKETAFDDLMRIIREVHAGQHPQISPSVKALLAERAARPALDFVWNHVGHPGPGRRVVGPTGVLVDDRGAHPEILGLGRRVRRQHR